MPGDEALSDGQRKLLNSLSRELFQTETSASQHCRREAERLRDTPPGVAMRAVAEHADSVLVELAALAERENLPLSRMGKLTGAFFSELRDKLADVLIHSERSYRGTLLGTRHGLDVVRSMRHVADASSKLGLYAFCEGWLNTRSILVDKLEEELAWFASHPEQAVEPARPLGRALKERQRHAPS